MIEQTERIFQDVRKNAMQAYIKYKTYCDKKANASKLKQADYVYILQPKADHQGGKILFIVFRWIGSNIIEKVLPNNNFCGTQNWHQKDAVTSSDEAEPIHTPPTYTGHTNHTT